jgi:hypothetical protein
VGGRGFEVGFGLAELCGDEWSGGAMGWATFLRV